MHVDTNSVRFKDILCLFKSQNSISCENTSPTNKKSGMGLEPNQRNPSKVQTNDLQHLEIIMTYTKDEKGSNNFTCGYPWAQMN